MAEMATLELRLDKGRVYAFDGAQHARAALRLPPNLDMLTRQVNQTREALRQQSPRSGGHLPSVTDQLTPQAAAPDAFGQAARALGEALFHSLLPKGRGRGPLALYRKLVDQASQTRSQLRLILAFALEGEDATGAAPLTALPWEYLYDTEIGHLAVSPRILLVRRYHLDRPQSALNLEYPLKVLVVLAQPWDQTQYIREEARRHLEDGLRRLHVSQVSLEFLPQPTFPSLAERLRDGGHQVLHFIGHGDFDEEDARGGLLCFEDAYGGTHRVYSEELRQHLSGLRLVVLTACSSAQTSPSDPFSGVAPALVLGGIPAVVAFREPVLVMAANQFVERLYSSLGVGQPIEIAVAEARRRLSSGDYELVRGEWSLPILYLQSELSATTQSEPHDTGTTFSEPPSPPNNLDYATIQRPNWFLGRGAEMIALARALREPLTRRRFITLRGAGGMGKSVLALECAHWHREGRYFLDGIFWFSARDRSAELVLGETATALGLPDFASLPEAQRTVLLAQTIAQREVLIVIDNADGLREDASFREFLGRLSPTGRGRVLLACRRAMQVDGEHLFPTDENLSPLPLEASVQLFLRHWEPETITQEQLKEVQLICGPRLLAGYPYCIEIAAGVAKKERLRDLSSLRRRLEQRLTETLRLPITSQEERSLVATLGLSYETLSPDTRDLLPRLAVYRLPFDLGAAQAVAGDLAQWRKGLTELLEAPLLDRVSFPGVGDRYLFHPVIREWAYPMLEEPVLVHATAGRYLVTAQELSDHLEGIYHLDRAGEGGEVVQEVSQIVNFLHLRGHWTEARWALELALRHAQALGDRASAGAIRGELGTNALRRGNLPQAIEYYQAAWAISRDLGDKRMEGTTLGNLGIFYRQQGDLPLAIDYHERALTISQKLGDKEMESNGLGNLGICYRQQGDLPLAIYYLRQVLTISQKLGDKEMESNALGNLGNCYRQQADLPRAIEHHQAALAISRELGAKLSEGQDLGNLGVCYLDMFNGEEAQDRNWELFLRGTSLVLASAQVFQQMDVPLPPATAGEVEALQETLGEEGFAELVEQVAPRLEDFVTEEVEEGKRAYQRLSPEASPSPPAG